jgi:hypothetical protein
MQYSLDLDIALHLCESHGHDLYHMIRMFVVLKCRDIVIYLSYNQCEQIRPFRQQQKKLSELDQLIVILCLKGKI